MIPTISTTEHVIDPGTSATADIASIPSVLFVDQSGQLGGAEFSLLPLASGWAARREVLLLSNGPFRQRLEAMGVKVHLTFNARVSGIRKKMLRPDSFMALPGILRQVRAISEHAAPFDVLFLNTQKALVLGALGKPLHRKKIIWHLRDIMTREHFGLFQRLIIKWITRYAVDHVVANSRASAAALVDLIKCEPDSVPVVHNGVDVGEFTSVTASDVDDVRRIIRAPDNTFLIGHFGRLAPWKGQHVALETLARLADAHLILVGSALFGEQDYVASLRTQAMQLGIEHRVHFVGFRDNVPAWMKAMDLILHTSTEPEPFGRVIIEGMAAGRPVVAAAAGGVLEILQHGANGWLVEPGDVSGFAEAVETLRQTPELAQRLADQAFSDVQRHFSLDRYLEQMTRMITCLPLRS